MTKEAIKAWDPNEKRCGPVGIHDDISAKSGFLTFQSAAKALKFFGEDGELRVMNVLSKA